MVKKIIAITTSILIVCFISTGSSENLEKYDFFIVLTIGLILSFIELASRYRSSPWRVLETNSGIIYVLSNGIICAISLYIIDQYNIIEPNGIKIDYYLASTLGSFMVMRSAILKLGNDKDSKSDIGLNEIIKKFLDMLDRDIDRFQAEERSKIATELMKDFPFEKCQMLLDHCFGIMQNITEDEVSSLSEKHAEISVKEDKEVHKSISFGLALYDIIGQSVLKEAITNINKIDHPENKNGNDIQDLSTNDIFEKLYKLSEESKTEA